VFTIVLSVAAAGSGNRLDFLAGTDVTFFFVSVFLIKYSSRLSK